MGDLLLKDRDRRSRSGQGDLDHGVSLPSVTETEREGRMGSKELLRKS